MNYITIIIIAAVDTYLSMQLCAAEESSQRRFLINNNVERRLRAICN